MNASRDAAIEMLRRAIEDAGPEPDYHRVQLARLQRTWPTLWNAIQEVLRSTQ